MGCRTVIAMYLWHQCDLYASAWIDLSVVVEEHATKCLEMDAFGGFVIEFAEYFVRELFSVIWTSDIVEHYLFFAWIDEFVPGTHTWPLVL